MRVTEKAFHTISLREHNYGVRLAVLEERSKGDRRAMKVRAVTVEKRLTDLNGEAGRLKAILDASVPKATFDAYVNTQRDKDDARERTQREQFESYAQAQLLKQDEYHRTQAAAFKQYADEMSRWRSSINVRIAGWAGGLAVLLAALQLWMKYGGTE